MLYKLSSLIQPRGSFNTLTPPGHFDSISCYDGLESGNAVALTEIVFRELNEANNLMESDYNNSKVCNIFRLQASTYRCLVLIKRPIIFISQSSQDIMAPGVNIIAAWSKMNTEFALPGQAPPDYVVISGT
ncbi:hypothetical protein POM88_030506 [Heracleum sosnowskyi]|uniref:Uncharacterized protein n=1 Tax=Heracleum sosnowskyi TaxID=360622 RepID=A0AAD8MJG0_9APIA|nr:hypothetical protein POM88_030506 [Heracleum sosnowskyi]